MPMQKSISRIFSFSVLFFLLGAGTAPAMNEDYSQAVAAAKAGDRIFAFMNFRDVAAHGSSLYREKALFALGEYYFSIRNNNEAFKSFEEMLSRYPDSKMKPFALFYMYKIANDSGNDGIAGKLKQEILDWERVILIFKKSKEHKLRSPMAINYKLIHYVDRLEFYIDGKLQEQVLY